MSVIRYGNIIPPGATEKTIRNDLGVEETGFYDWTGDWVPLETRYPESGIDLPRPLPPKRKFTETAKTYIAAYSQPRDIARGLEEQKEEIGKLEAKVKLFSREGTADPGLPAPVGSLSSENRRSFEHRALNDIKPDASNEELLNALAAQNSQVEELQLSLKLSVEISRGVTSRLDAAARFADMDRVTVIIGWGLTIFSMIITALSIIFSG